MSLVRVEPVVRTVLERLRDGLPPLADCEGPDDYCDRLDALKRLQADGWVDADRRLTPHSRAFVEELAV